MRWYLSVLEDYRGFRGRARRAEYWRHLIGLVPHVGPIVLPVFFALEGEPRENRFGPSPRPLPDPRMVYPRIGVGQAGAG